MKQTAMQELLEWVRATLPMDLDTSRMIEQKIESMLEKEKDLIQNVFQEGQEFPPLIDGKDHYSWLNYYNETYGGNK